MEWTQNLYGMGSMSPGPQCDSACRVAGMRPHTNAAYMAPAGKPRFGNNMSASPGPRYLPAQPKGFSSLATKTTFNCGKRFRPTVKQSQEFGPAKYMPTLPRGVTSGGGAVGKASRFGNMQTCSPGPGHVKPKRFGPGRAAGIGATE